MKTSAEKGEPKQGQEYHQNSISMKTQQTRKTKQGSTETVANVASNKTATKFANKVITGPGRNLAHRENGKQQNNE